jgi:hypothetical protein
MSKSLKYVVGTEETERRVCQFSGVMDMVTKYVLHFFYSTIETDIDQKLISRRFFICEGVMSV